MRDCKNVKELDPISKLCPPCNIWVKDFNKRQSNNERQQFAREGVQNQNRNLSSPGGASPSSVSNNSPPVTAQPTAPPTAPLSQTWVRPAGSSAQVATPPPPIDMAYLQNTYNQLKSSSTESPLLLDMFAVMLNIHSKQSETEDIRIKIEETISRLESVEAKVGDTKEVAERLGLAVRFLPLPPTGYSDLDIVKQIFHEIRAPGIDVNRDITKATRKLPVKPNTNSAQPVLGTVLVEMRNEEARSSIMKNKHTLQQHPDNNIANIVIKNMKSKEQMFMENLGNNILKRIPGCENTFVTPNGQIREGFQSNNFQPRYQNRQPPHQYRQDIYPSRPQYNATQYNRPQYNTPHFSNQTQQPYSYLNMPRPVMANHSYQHPQSQLQPQQIQPYRDPIVFDNNSSKFPAPVPCFPNPPPVAVPIPQTTPQLQDMPGYPIQPPVAVPQPQAVITQTPLKDLLGNLDSLYEQPPPPGPSRQAAPDLHLLQPAVPHYDHAEQHHHRQHSQARQEQQPSQVRGHNSDSD